MIINFLQQSETLRRLLLNHNTDLTEDSLFSHSSEELEQFLSEAMIGDAFVSSSNLSYENGEFVFTDEFQENNDDFTGILNDFLQNDDVKNIVDANSNGTLGIEEINDFLDALEALDENPDDISMNDVFSAIQSIGDGTFGNTQTEETPAAQTETTPAETVNPTSNSNGTRRTSGSGRTSGRGSSDSSSSSSSSTQSENISSMSLEQLESKKTEQETAVKTAQEKVNAAYAGETDAIKTAQADCDAKKQAYEEALASDEGVSEELRTQQQENQTNIDNQKTTINEVKSDINTKEDEITSQKSTISADESNISGLKNAISKLQNQSSDDEDVKSEIASKLQSAKSKLKTAEEKLASDKAQLEKLESEKTDLETKLKEEEGKLTELETERETIEANILANCGEATKTALEAFKQAEKTLEEIKASEIEKAKAEQTAAQSKLDEINAAINTKNTKQVESEFAVNDLGNVEELYKSMGLDEKGLNFEVFSSALEGYNNLTDEQKASGFLGIFDTTQGDNANRYYLLDLNTFELVGQSQMKTGSGNMDNIETANKHGSHATLSGFEMVGAEYYSGSMEKRALRLIGLEEGINDNALAKGTVVHYTTGNHTWGCKGFPPVRTNGRIDKEATYDLMRELFPTNAIIYTHPTDEDYWDMSELYA